MNKSLAILLAGTLAVSVYARVWKDNQGRPMSADFVQTIEVGGETVVVFKKGDGLRYQFPLARLSEQDQAYIAQLQANAGTAAPSAIAPVEREMTEFEQSISKYLVRLDVNRVSRVKADELEPKDYYAIYYSAHWCPPCRSFTPKLVDFYNAASSKHDNFEIIFVSSDRSEEAMEEYMRETGMPWLALDYDKKKRARDLTRYAGRGIPCLVLVDKNGEVLSHSYEGKEYVGPSKVMGDLEAKLNAGS